MGQERRMIQITQIVFDTVKEMYPRMSWTERIQLLLDNQKIFDIKKETKILDESLDKHGHKVI
jgi:hypothetical protein